MTTKKPERSQLNLSNFPTDVHKELRKAAKLHRRSVSQEAAILLEEMLAIKSMTKQ